MKLYPPYKNAKLTDISQKFGVNPNSYQPNGHTGIDFSPVNGYGMFLVAPENVKISKIITDKEISGSLNGLNRGYGILMQSQSETDLYYLYWHCLPVFPVEVGDYIDGGQIVAQMGNSGKVFMGGVLVSLAERVKTKYGTHVHYERAYFRNNRYEYTDCLPFIDFNLPIKYNIIQAIQQIVQKMFNLLK